MARSGKKSGPTALQIEVNSDEDWDELLLEKTKGLLVVDVYSDWSGPCAAMVSTLRKIKMELGGEIISYALAKNDAIESLRRFRGTCEPTWMFIENGKMVNMVFGAHCPKLQSVLVDEIRRVQQQEEPKWSVEVTERGPEEQARWQHAEGIRKAKEAARLAREEAERKEKYEAFLGQMMLELCEETVLVLYPWVFFDEDGLPKEKMTCPAYVELTQELLKQYFDLLEETRLELTEDLVEAMLVESGVDFSDDVIEGLTRGKCMAMRLRGRPPHADWPVKYPYECPPDDSEDLCPTRAIGDVEKFLQMLIFGRDLPPLVNPAGQEIKRTVHEECFYDRHVYVVETTGAEHEGDQEDEGEEQKPELEEDESSRKVFPAVWVPPQARSKVHAMKTLFPSYMEKSHPYEEPVPPAPLCVFKFEAGRIQPVLEAYNNFPEAIEHFGAFQFDKPSFGKRLASSPEDFLERVKNKTGLEMLLVVIRRISEPAFLAFAGIEPYFVTEDEEEAEEIIRQYFPDGFIEEHLLEGEAGEEMFSRDEQEEEEEKEEDYVGPEKWEEEEDDEEEEEEEGEDVSEG